MIAIDGAGKGLNDTTLPSGRTRGVGDGPKAEQYAVRSVAPRDLALDGDPIPFDLVATYAQSDQENLIAQGRQSLARRYQRGTSVRVWAIIGVGVAVAVASGVAAIVLATGF